MSMSGIWQLPCLYGNEPKAVGFVRNQGRSTRKGALTTENVVAPEANPSADYADFCVICGWLCGLAIQEKGEVATHVCGVERIMAARE